MRRKPGMKSCGGGKEEASDGYGMKRSRRKKKRGGEEEASEGRGMGGDLGKRDSG